LNRGSHDSGKYSESAHAFFGAPGRLNLIGEHTDYNDSFVMPAAIGFCTWVAAAKREDRRLEAYSDHFDEKISLSLDDLSGDAKGHWSDFIRGVAAALKRAGHSLTGANLTKKVPSEESTDLLAGKSVCISRRKC
jgi:galactokinase